MEIDFVCVSHGLSFVSSQKKLPQVPESLLKKRKANDELRAKRAKSVVLSKKVSSKEMLLKS